MKTDKKIEIENKLYSDFKDKFSTMSANDFWFWIYEHFTPNTEVQKAVRESAELLETALYYLQPTANIQTVYKTYSQTLRDVADKEEAREAFIVKVENYIKNLKEKKNE